MSQGSAANVGRGCLRLSEWPKDHPRLSFLTTNTREYTRITTPHSCPLAFIRGSKFWDGLGRFPGRRKRRPSDRWANRAFRSNVTVQTAPRITAVRRPRPNDTADRRDPDRLGRRRLSPIPPRRILQKAIRLQGLSPAWPPACPKRYLQQPPSW
jgi:hypothetical protein